MEPKRTSTGQKEPPPLRLCAAIKEKKRASKENLAIEKLNGEAEKVVMLINYYEHTQPVQE